MINALPTRTLVLALAFVASRSSHATVYPGEWFIYGGDGLLVGQAEADMINIPGDTSLVITEAHSVADTSINDTLRNAYSASILYHFTTHFGMGAEIMLPATAARYKSSCSSSFADGAPLCLQGNSQQFYMATSRWVFMPEREWNPYVIGKVGVARNSITLNSGPQSAPACGGFGCANGPMIPHHATIPAISVGIGTEGSFYGHGTAGVELSFLYTPSATDNEQGTVVWHSNFLTSLAIKLGVNFGGQGRQ